VWGSKNALNMTPRARFGPEDGLGALRFTRLADQEPRRLRFLRLMALCSLGPIGA
jgi:hypothetical protein